MTPTDIYDFAGWLTTRPGMMKVGSAFDAAPMADAVGEYLSKFPERFGTPVEQSARAAPAQSAAADEMVDLLLREVEKCPSLPIGESEAERDAWTHWATTVLYNLGFFELSRKHGAAPAQDVPRWTQEQIDAVYAEADRLLPKLKAASEAAPAQPAGNSATEC